MKNKFAVWVLGLIIGTVILSACVVTTTGTSERPSPVLKPATTTRQAPEVVATKESPTPLPTPTTKPTAPVSPTTSVTPTATVEAPDLYPGWESFENSDYGFTFRYLPSWMLAADKNHVTLSRDELLFAIAFQHPDENVPTPWSGLPAGELEERGSLPFLGHEIDKRVLVYEGRVKALVYGPQDGDVVIAMRLDDLSAQDYQEIEITPGIEVEIDQIVGSFSLYPPPESAGDGNGTTAASTNDIPLPERCLAGEGLLFVNPSDGYCLRYPHNFEPGDIYPTGIANLYGLPYDCSVEPVRAALSLTVEQPSPKHTLSQLVDAWLNFHSVQDLTRREQAILDGVPAEIVEGQGELSRSRVLFTFHESRFYALSFYPLDERFHYATPDLELLYRQVTDSFQFLPQETAAALLAMDEVLPDPTPTPGIRATSSTGWPPPSFDAAVYRDERVGFEFDYPSNWTLMESGENEAQITVTHLSAQPPDQSYLDVAVASWKPYDLDSYAALREQTWATAEMTIYSKQEWLLGGSNELRGFCYVVEAQPDRTVFLITAVGEHYIVLSGSGNLPLLIEIVRSVRPLS